jgi:hypothetical protein
MPASSSADVADQFEALDLGLLLEHALGQLVGEDQLVADLRPVVLRRAVTS